MSNKHQVTVDLGARSYPIDIGPGLLNDLPQIFSRTSNRNQIIVVSDTQVMDHHGERLRGICEAAGLTFHPLIIPAGEHSKNWDQLAKLVGSLLDLGVSRKDSIVAFGGGVVGDLAGFAAAIVKRGCSFIQVPTTLLAQVDSSVGGKTAINTPQGKNLVGAFHQPKHVIIDTDLLATLPPRELRAGYAEVVKYGLIDDLSFFQWLDQEGDRVINLEGDAVSRAVARSCAAKARIVAQDETEQDKRALLNLGHTFGHALEAVNKYDGRLLHGEAVGIGMVAAMAFSAAHGWAPQEDVEKLRAHLARLDMRTEIAQAVPADVDADQLMAAMMQDKKNEDGKLVLILSEGIGKAFVRKDVDVGMVHQFWREALATVPPASKKD